ncbi:MAG: portal protein [Planctomycetota bacterium]|jgi:hypothetical protein
MPEKVATTDTNEQKAILAQTEKLIFQGLEGRKNSNVLVRAQKFDDYSWGDHPVKEDFGRKGKTYNKFSEIVETRVAHLTDNRPKWVFGPQEEGDLFTARALNQILGDYLWDKIGWDDRGEDAVLEAAASGTCHIKIGVGYDGWPNFTVVQAESVIVDPQAQKHRQLRFIGHFIARSPEYILKEYKVKVSPEADFDRQNKGSNYNRPTLSYQQSSGGTTAPFVWSRLRDSNRRSTVIADVLGKAIICEMHMDDYTLEPVPFVIEETNLEHSIMSELQPVSPQIGENVPKHLKEHKEFLATLDPEIDKELIALLTKHIVDTDLLPKATKRYKYPYGRIVTVCQGKLLRDEPNKLAESINVDWKELWVKFDYTKSRNYYWGKGLAHDLYDPQDDFNYQQNAITQNIKMLLNGIRKWKRGRFKVEELKRITNMIGKNVLVDDPNDVTVDFGKELPSSHFNNLVSIERFMDRQAGNTDIMGGNLPKGSPAGVTIDQLMQTGTARIRLALRHYMFALNWMAKIAIMIMIEYTDPSEEFEIMGESGQIELRQWRELRETLKGSNVLKNVRIDIRSLTASTRKQDQEQAIALFQAGVYDRQAVLEKLDDPDKYAIIQRINEIEQLKGQLQQAGELIDQQQKQINTFVNRAQKEEGQGNVGIPTTQ